jgi:CHAT domain-containing protein
MKSNPDYSHSQPVDVKCSRCGHEYSGELWLIVDVLAKRDLYRRLLDGTLHFLRCPRELTVGVTVAVPFLLFRADAELKLIFCVPSDTKPDEISPQAKVCLNLLKGRMGDAWDDSWPKTAMGSALDIGLDSMLSDEWGDLQLYSKSDPLLENLTSFLNVKDLDQKRQLLFADPDFLSESAINFLGHYRQALTDEGRPIKADDVESQRQLLERCTEIGVNAAFAEFREQHPPPLTIGNLDSETRVMLEEALAIPRNPEDGLRKIELCENLVARLEQNSLFSVMAQTTLARRYYESAAGDRRANVEHAIELLTSLLAGLHPQQNPDAWTSAIVSLSNAYQLRIEGRPVSNFRQAIELCEGALENISEIEFPDSFCGLMDTLASAYLDDPGGDRADNIERAIAAYRKILQVTKYPDAQTIFLHNLARAYGLRIRGDHDENLERSIELYELVLTGISAETDSSSFALLRNNLAVSYLERKLGQRSENVERAIQLYEEVLEVWTRAATPIEWAKTMMNLGTAYAVRVNGDRQENQRLAISCMEQATEVLNEPTVSPFDWATLQTDLATALSFGAKDLPLQDSARAINLFKASFTVFTPDEHPLKCRQAAFSLGSIYFEDGSWSEAYDYFKLGLEAADALYRSAYVPTSQRIEMQINADLFDRIVSTCARLKDDPEMCRRGLIHAEAARDRQFVAQMGTAKFPTPAGLDPEKLQQEASLINQIRGLEQALSSSNLANDREQNLAMDRQKVRAQLNAIWQDFETVAPAYVGLRRGDTASWSEIKGLSDKLGAQTGIVSFYTIEDEIICFILRAGWDSPLLKQLPISRNMLVYRYLLPYQREVLTHVDFAQTNQAATHAWMELGEALLAPLKAELADCSLVYFIPHGHLHTVPLHALTVKGTPFIELHSVAYAPSINVLRRLLEADAESTDTTTTSALVMGYTPSTDQKERALFLGEANAVADRFRTSALLDEQANKTALMQSATGATVIHLSCHGSFDSEDPLSSGLLLADGVLSAREIMELSLHADLVTVSACESGFSTTSKGEELAGISRALLYAGSSSSLLALWQVDAATTLEWMIDFYRRTRDSIGNKIMDDATAFREATLALKARHPDPVFWAPFVLIGDWH